MYCPFCGSRQPDMAMFCGACGNRLPIQGAQPAGYAGTAFSYASQGSASKRSHKTLIGVAAAMVVATAVIVGVVIAVGGLAGGGHEGISPVGGGHRSPEEICKSAEDQVNKLYSSEMSDSDVRAYGNALFDEMHPQLMTALEKRMGLTREEMLDKLVDSTGESSQVNAALNELKDVCTAEAHVELGDRADSDDLDNFNDDLAEAGVEARVDDMYDLDISYEYVYIVDYAGVNAGDTRTQDLGNFTGMKAVHLDGSWYLWTPTV